MASNHHKENVIRACNELGGYEVLNIVAVWFVDVLLKAPHIQQREDVQDRVLKCAQEIKAVANRLLVLQPPP